MYRFLRKRRQWLLRQNYLVALKQFWLLWPIVLVFRKTFSRTIVHLTPFLHIEIFVNGSQLCLNNGKLCFSAFCPHEKKSRHSNNSFTKRRIKTPAKQSHETYCIYIDWFSHGHPRAYYQQHSYISHYTLLIMVCLASHCRTMRVLGVLVVTALLLAPLEAAVQHVQRDLADGTYAYLFITLSGQQRSPRVLVTIWLKRESFQVVLHTHSL